MKKMLKTLKIFSAMILVVIMFVLAPTPSKAASFPVSGGGTKTAGQTFTITISANHSAAYNGVSLTASVSNLTILGASGNSFWTSVGGAQVSGNTVSFSGASLGNSATGTKTALTITVRAPSTPGNSSISTSGNITLADGSGTKVGASGSASFTIVAAPTPTPTAKPAPGPVSISSSTHPDQSKWFKSVEPVFSWNQESGVTDFSYVFDNVAGTSPDDVSEGVSITKSYTGLTDGTYYFHIKAKNDVGWGPASHFAINIDTSSPDPFTATSVKNSDGSYQVFFSTTDKASGAITYTAKTDDKDLGAVISGFTVPSGTKSLTITATDNAGNTKASTLSLETASTTASITPTNENSSSTNSATSKASNNLNVALVIALILLLIYALIITTLYLMEKGYLKQFVNKLDGTKSFGKKKETDFGTSPLNNIKHEEKK